METDKQIEHQKKEQNRRTFLNLHIDKKFQPRLFLIHFVFFSLWLIGILLIGFRIDDVLIGKIEEKYKWLTTLLPLFYFVVLIVILFRYKWYYKIVFIIYPLLVLFWFLPKTILSWGKIYLLGNYISSVFRRLKHLKITLLHLVLMTVSTILFLFLNSAWIKWLIILLVTYFYIRYLIRVLKKSLTPPSLFAMDLEESVKKAISRNNSKNSLIISFIANNKEDEKLQEEERKNKIAERGLFAKIIVDTLTTKLNSYKSQRAFLISALYSGFMFFLTSILYFWFINFQLYKINLLNFQYTGKTPAFDFLYYTFKTITFSSVDFLQPISILARSCEMISYFTLGILFLVIFMSIFLSAKQEKLNKNIALTTQFLDSENQSLTDYFQENYGTEIEKAIEEAANLKKSFTNLKNIIDQLF